MKKLCKATTIKINNYHLKSDKTMLLKGVRSMSRVVLEIVIVVAKVAGVLVS